MGLAAFFYCGTLCPSNMISVLFEEVQFFFPNATGRLLLTILKDSGNGYLFNASESY